MAKLVRKVVKVQKAWLKPSKTPVELLKKLRKLLEKPERWVKDVMAEDAYGYGAEALEPGVTCFCMLGALRRVEDGTQDKIITEVEKALAKTAMPVAVKEFEKSLEYTSSDDYQYEDFLPTFNDAERTRHRDVLRVIDKAIASLKAGV